MKTQREHCEDRSRGWNDTATNQGKPRINGPPETRKSKERFSLTGFKRRTAWPKL